MHLWLTALILSLVEGLTEFIPVSSTGHLILVGELLGFTGDLASTFTIFIQFGAILAVVVLYWDRFTGLLRLPETSGFHGSRGIGLLALTSLPGLIGGFLAYATIRDRLFQPWTVAVGLAVGGVALLVIDSLRPEPRIDDLDAVTWRVALIVGLSQVFALWPGVSRSAATIVGGMLAGVSRKTAAEYSFFAAVPIITAAALYDLLQSLSFLTAADIPLLAFGLVASFVAAWFAVRFFIRLVQRYTLRPFGAYRLVVAAAVLLVVAL